MSFSIETLPLSRYLEFTPYGALLKVLHLQYWEPDTVSPWRVAHRRERENQGQEECAEHRAERTQRDDTV